jgi:site-specific recombinase XerD
MAYRHNKLLPVSEREIPDQHPFIHAGIFLREAGINSERTERTYRAGLRALADWLQVQGRAEVDLESEWPLATTAVTTVDILQFRSWMLANRSQTTARTYLAAVVSFFHFLDGIDQGPPGLQLGKLAQQRKRRRMEQNMAAAVVDKDEIRQDIPQIVEFYVELPLPAQNDKYNRRLSLLRDRALVHVLYSTAARLSEVLALNRSQVQHGRAQTATIVGKGGRPRTLHFMPYAQEQIRAYLNERHDANPALFVSHSRNANGSRLSASGAHNVIKRAVKGLGLDYSLSAHDFRHYRATQLLREGMPLEVVQELLGHADISTTRGIYAPVLGVHLIREWLDNLDRDPMQAAQKRDASDDQRFTPEL